MIAELSRKDDDLLGMRAALRLSEMGVGQDAV
jgi:hypothetical protein